MLHSASSLKGSCLAASDGDIGHVSDIYFDSRAWAVRYLLVNTGAWLLGKEILIPAGGLGLINLTEKSIRVNLTLEKVKSAPDGDTHRPVSRQEDIAYEEYYGFPPGLGPGADRELRSVHDVIGHTLKGSDHEIGFVRDFLVDDADWSTRFFIADTALWFGKAVVVPTAAIRAVSWVERTVYLSISRDRVKQSPEYHAGITATTIEEGAR